jgi:hypothetical protein
VFAYRLRWLEVDAGSGSCERLRERCVERDVHTRWDARSRFLRDPCSSLGLRRKASDDGQGAAAVILSYDLNGFLAPRDALDRIPRHPAKPALLDRDASVADSQRWRSARS